MGSTSRVRVAVWAICALLSVAGFLAATSVSSSASCHSQHGSCVVSDATSSCHARHGTCQDTTTTTTTTTVPTTTTDPATTTAETTTTTSTPPTPMSFPKMGIAASYMNDAQTTQVADGLAAVGAKGVRVDFAWYTIEPTQGTYSWSHMDTIVQAMTSRGITILGTCAYTPAWANGGHSDDKYPPLRAYYGSYASFCAAAAARYPQVPAWEVWNEQNTDGFWHSPNAADYVALLRATDDALHAVNPAITVVSGGLSPHGDIGTIDSGGINPRTFLQQMYAAGAHGAMDAVGDHPYNLPSAGSYQEMGDLNPSIRSIMVANGDAGELIWPTEFGLPLGLWGAQTEQQQADGAAAILADIKTRDYVGPLFWFSYADYIGPGFGLVRSDWTHRPVWDVYAASAAG